MSKKLAGEEARDSFGTPKRKRAKPIQLDKIIESVKGLLDPYDLETIQHFNFPPWKRDTPYKVNISKLSKEEAASLYNMILFHQDKNTTTIYTDVSSTEDGVGVGVGLTAKNASQQTIHHEMKNIGSSQLVYNGELLPVTKELQYSNKISKPGLNFKVYSGNQAGLHRLKTPSDNPEQCCQIRAIRASKSIINKGAPISLNWVPGHTDVDGNEEADGLAKAAIKICSSSNKKSFAFAGMIVKPVQNR
ncbi:putative reverse transcriptase protein [Botrytis cinerea BcDW1]|uniref:ribonuclease H n=1 Tax=Botryotinia fuckeliana (strain BcDW1) TaxID=1290391 RepID=M7U7G9_BOTF1|nr:putative reverse transcriptase protein [Botrytis cinerea BcDW1]